MDRKHRAVKEKSTSRKPVNTPEQAMVQVSADMEVLRGRYANSIRVLVQQEDFVLDFLASAGDQITLVSRVYITPHHAKRLHDVLRGQLSLYRKKTQSLRVNPHSKRG